METFNDIISYATVMRESNMDVSIKYELPTWLRNWLCKEPNQCPDCTFCKMHTKSGTKMRVVLHLINTLARKFPKKTYPKVYHILEQLYIRLKLNEQDYTADWVNKTSGRVFRTIEKRQASTPNTQSPMSTDYNKAVKLLDKDEYDERVMRSIWHDHWQNNPEPEPVNVSLFWNKPEPIIDEYDTVVDNTEPLDDTESPARLLPKEEITKPKRGRRKKK